MNPIVPREIEPRDAKAWIASDRPPRIIDCREPDEFAHCRIDGAELLPVSQWPALALRALTDPAQPILVYCHHGIRSMRAAHFLEARGFADVRSLAGGIERWSTEVDPSVPRY